MPAMLEAGAPIAPAMFAAGAPMQDTIEAISSSRDGIWATAFTPAGSNKLPNGFRETAWNGYSG